MLRLRAGVAALKKGIGMGSADPKGTKLPHAAAATDAAAIQHRLALAILVRTQTFVFQRLICSMPIHVMHCPVAS